MSLDKFGVGVRMLKIVIVRVFFEGNEYLVVGCLGVEIIMIICC